MSRNQATYTFGDDTSPVRPGRKHRRGRGHSTPNRNNTAPSNRNTAHANSNQQNRNHTVATAPTANKKSYWQGGHHNPPAASSGNQRQQPQQQAQANYFTGDGWDNPPNNNKANNTSNDDNDGTGSLDYSASSSVMSAESSNDSSFADIMKVVDSSEGENVNSEIREFMAKQSKAANDAFGGMGHSHHNKMKGMGMETSSGTSSNNSAAVAGWMQRRGRNAQQKAKKHPFHPFGMGASRQPSKHVDLDYSKDSSEGDVYGVEFNEHEENVLETIAGKRDDDAVRHTVTVTSAKSQASSNNDPFLQDPCALRNHDPYQTSSSPYNSAPSSPQNSGNITPPPYSRQRGDNSFSRTNSGTNSRHSKSSSDGSWDTPPPSSPPQNGGSMHSKPPHARSMPVGKSRRNGSGLREGKVVTEDLSEAFYAKSWMCGFTDAFNFDGFEKSFQK